MGALTNDMKRLRGEVETLRQERGALMQDLALGTMQRRDAVAALQAGFRKNASGHGPARPGRTQSLYHGQKRVVAHLRKAFATDLAGAARAWFGVKA